MLINLKKQETPEEEKKLRKTGADEADKVVQDSFWSANPNAFECSDDVQECSNGVQKRSKSVQTVFKSVQKMENEQILNTKAARNADIERYMPLKVALFVGMFICSGVSTVEGAPLQMQVSFYLATAAVFIACDPIGALERTLAHQARFIIAFLIANAVMLVNVPRIEILALLVISTISGAVIIRLLNGRWLAAENWLMSAEVQRALRGSSGHYGKEAAANWQAHGKRETATILYEMGFGAWEEVLDSLHPVFICAYMHGAKKADEYAKKLDDVEQRLVDSMNYIDELEEEVKRIPVSSGDEEGLAILEVRIQSLEAENRRLKKLVRNLEEANEELREKDPEETPMLTRDEEILQLHEKGLSYRKIAERLGCSVGTITSVVNKAKAIAV